MQKIETKLAEPDPEEEKRLKEQQSRRAKRRAANPDEYEDTPEESLSPAKQVAQPAAPKEGEEPAAEQAAPDTLETKIARYKQQLKQLERDLKESDDEFVDLPLKIKIDAQKKEKRS